MIFARIFARLNCWLYAKLAKAEKHEHDRWRDQLAEYDREH